MQTPRRSSLRLTITQLLPAGVVQFVRKIKRARLVTDPPYEQLRALTPLAASRSEPRYIFSTADSGSVSRQVFAYGRQDQREMQWALDQLGNPQKGKAVVDVGANIGTSAIPLLTRFGATRVFAFEPDALNFRLLRCNLILNELEGQVTARRAAISDADGEVILEMSAGNLGGHQIRVEGASAAVEQRGESTWTTVPVEAVTLDGALKGALDEIGLVWVDTQGHEAQVLAGAQGLLSRRVPWVIEYWPYGLTLAGGLERLQGLVGEHFERIIDVRRSMRLGRVVDFPADRVAEVQCDKSDPDDFTDLLLVPSDGDGDATGS